jgi:hypothetical protein
VNKKTCSVFFFCFLMLGSGRVWAATAAGTPINNTATASFADANSNAFSTISNTVTLTVQNAPALTVTAPGNQPVTPAMIAVDTFTLSNTGNDTGNFQLSGEASFSGTALSTTLKGYVYGSSCTLVSPCSSWSALNAALIGSGNAVPLNGTLTIGVEYQVSASATPGQTVQTTLSANSTSVAVTGAPTETSVNVTATSTDTLIVDARLDVKVSATSAPTTITWTIEANNGGGYAAQGLASAKTVLGASNNGLAIFIPLPSYNSAYLQLQAAPTVPTLSGASSGATATVYYNTTACSATPTSGWSTAYTASAECLAVYVSNTSPPLLPSAPSGSNGAGGVSAAQITFSFTTNQPSGSGSGTADSVTLIASSAIGGDAWATGTVPIIGQGVIIGTPDTATASLLVGVEGNTTPSSLTTPPGGASNAGGSQASTSYQLLNGPYSAPGAAGLYPGAAGNTADTAHDFTAYNVPCTSSGGSGVNGTPCTVGVNITIVNSVENTGNLSDTITLSATAPAGWTVQLYSAAGCTAFTGAGCTNTGISGVSGVGGTVVSVPVALPFNTTLNYAAVYNATSNSATPFTAYTAKITAAGQSGAGTGVDTNDTYNTLYPGGVVQLTNLYTVTAANCPAGQSPTNNGACPGGKVQYALLYNNVCPANVGTASGSTEPAFAVNALTVGTMVITDDGTAGTNNWTTYTNGIQAAATDTTGGTIFTYSNPGGPSTTFIANQTKLSAQVGGAGYQLGPGASGTITFNVIVK